MALFTLLAWVLAQEEHLAQGHPPVKRRAGRPQVITPAVEQDLAARVDRKKQAVDNRKIEIEIEPHPGGHCYDCCTDAAALRLVALDLYRERLIREGSTRGEAERQVDAIKATRGFQRRLRSYRVSLARHRARDRR